MTITIKRPGDPVTTVATPEIDDQTIRSHELMGMDKITAVFTLSTPVGLQLNDYIEFQSNEYKIKELPRINKINNATYEYQVTFEAPIYDLYDKMLMDEGVSIFSYSGTPLELLTLIKDNMQEFDVGWAIGDCSRSAEVKTFLFDQQSCRKALSQIAEEFELEYYVDGQDLYLKETIGTTHAETFEYGQGNGLWSLTRRSIDLSFSTRWYGFGGTRNLPATYRSGLGRLTFDDLKVENNVGTYGVKEGSVTYDEIFPRFEGEVDSSADNNSVVDSSIDFDLNNQFIGEGQAKIVFKTGDLGGNEFVITQYDHSAKKVTFGTITEESGYELPNDTVNPSAGDEFTFVNIEMPTTYIDAAETELENKVDAFVAVNSAPKVAYDLDIDEKYVRDNSLENVIVAGDKVTVFDTPLSINQVIRVQSVEFPLVNQAKIRAVISDDPIYTTADKLVKEQKKLAKKESETQASALYAEQVADEIRNYAFVEQFEKSKVGDRAMMSGAFIAGNPTQGENAGINGAGTADTDVRFWAGADYDNRATAPFRVLHNGKVFFTGVDNSGNTDKMILNEDNGIGSSASDLWMDNMDDIKASIFGVYDGDSPVSLSGEVYAAVIGASYEDMNSSSLPENNLINCTNGVYGVLASSFKNLGQEARAIRQSTTIDERDRVVVIITGGTKTLPERPDRGHVLTIKNQSAGSITIQRGGSVDQIYLTDQVIGVNSFSLPSGSVANLIFWGTTRHWYLLNKISSKGKVEKITNASSGRFYYVAEDDVFVFVRSAVSTVYLPRNPEDGRVVEIKNYRSSGTTLRRQGSDNILNYSNSAAISISLGAGHVIKLRYRASGSYWVLATHGH